MKKTLLVGFYCGLAISLWGGSGTAYAQTPEPDFSQLERVSAQHKPCKRMEKEFQPALQEIEKARWMEGIDTPSHVLWVADDYFNSSAATGYCMAVSYPPVGNITLLLKQFPKEFPDGGRIVRWDPDRRETVSGNMPSWSSWEREWDWAGVESMWGEIESLRTTYYDRKNKIYHWMEYRLRDRDVNTGYPFSSKSVLFLERHYRTLLDDLAETAEAGPRRNLLALQLLQLQAYLRESFNDTAFLEAEHKRRGPLMRILDGARIEDLAVDQWTHPDVCTDPSKGDRWWPCFKEREIVFSQLERLTELRPCKRMEKEFQPFLSEIEKDRQKTGIGTRLLWVDLYNTGYCTALPVPLTELGQLSLERFPKEIPFGFRAVNWNTVQQDIDWSLPYTLDGTPSWEQDIDWSLPYKSGGASLLDNVWSLITLYYDKKNKRLYWMEYQFEKGFRSWKVSKQGGLEETDTIQLGKAHYRNLLDDLAVMAKAKQRDRALVSQVDSMRRYLTGYANEHKEYSYGSELLEFLKTEHQRRGELMNFLEEEIKAFNEDKSVSAWTKAMTKLSEQMQAWKQANEAERQARNENTDFSRLERVSAQHKPCKRMDKAFQPAFRKIEETRRYESRKRGIEGLGHVLWVDDNRGTGYCMAVSYPLFGDNPLILKHFPEVFPFGGRYVRWDPARRKPESDTLGSMVSWRFGSGPMGGMGEVEHLNIESLRTAYYDRKNKTYHWMEYRLRGEMDDMDDMDSDDYEYSFSSTSLPFLERHYRTLLDDLAETAEAGPRRNLLVLQILQLQATLQAKRQFEAFQETGLRARKQFEAFMEAERQRRGPLMQILDGARIEELERDAWTYPDMCTADPVDSARWRPCNKLKAGE